MRFQPDIDHREQLPDITEIGLKDLAVNSRSVRSTATGRGDNKVITYRHGIATNLGNIERSLWKEVAAEVVKRECGETTMQSMTGFLSEGRARSRVPEDIYEEAIELCIEKSFDNPEWAYFVLYNEMFRPEALAGTDLVSILPLCCHETIRATKKQLRDPYWFFCPRCNRRTAYTFARR